MATLHEVLCKFMISWQIILKMRNVWDKCCRESPNIHLYSI